MNDPVHEALNRAADECSPEDIDEIIKFIRNSKASYERGEKPKKEGAEENILDVIKVTPASTPGFVRRC